jgi:hypothetical protein
MSALAFDWSKTIFEMRAAGLPGLSAMLACHCETTSFQADPPSLGLRMAPELAGLQDSPWMLKLQQALRDRLGANLALTIELAPTTQTPAQKATKRRVSTYTEAYEGFMQDKFVNDLIKDFGAKIITETVRPAAAKTPPKP